LLLFLSVAFFVRVESFSKRFYLNWTKKYWQKEKIKSRTIIKTYFEVPCKQSLSFSLFNNWTIFKLTLLNLKDFQNVLTLSAFVDKIIDTKEKNVRKMLWTKKIEQFSEISLKLEIASERKMSFRLYLLLCWSLLQLSFAPELGCRTGGGRPRGASGPPSGSRWSQSGPRPPDPNRERGRCRPPSNVNARRFLNIQILNY